MKFEAPCACTTLRRAAPKTSRNAAAKRRRLNKVLAERSSLQSVRCAAACLHTCGPDWQCDHPCGFQEWRRFCPSSTHDQKSPVKCDIMRARSRCVNFPRTMARSSSSDARKLLTSAMIARIEAQFHLPVDRTEVESDWHYQSTETPNVLGT